MSDATMTMLPSAVLTTERRPRQQALEDVWSVVAKLEIVRDANAETALLRRLTAPQRPTVVAFVNQHALNLAWSKPEFASALRQSNVLLRDGVGIECFLRANGCPTGRNMNGTDFIPKLAAGYAGRRVALFGTAEPWTAKAAAVLERLGCTVVATLHGFHPAAVYVEAVASVKPELVLLAMSMPKQEQVAANLAGCSREPILIVSGGAIADFLAGRFERAPKLMRQIRMEWLYRLALEPKRLASRYITGGAAFVWRGMMLRRVSTSVLIRLLQEDGAWKS